MLTILFKFLFLFARKKFLRFPLEWFLLEPIIHFVTDFLPTNMWQRQGKELHFNLQFVTWRVQFIKIQCILLIYVDSVTYVIISKDILLFPRTIGNAALAIVKGYIRPVDVMEIKVSFYHDWNWKYLNAII